MNAGLGLVEGPLHFLSATAAATAIAKRELSPVELMKAYLARIEKLDPALNVFIRLDAEAALEAARIAEAEAMAGRLRGPLHGVPVGIKDIIDVAGLPTTCHSKVLEGNMATADAVCVAKLRQAGAISVGKLSTHEFAIGGPSFDLPWPPARNPWNPDHHPGGSSSGSGSGLAAGLFPLALGTDTGGSVRNPASCCGIVGLKPTYGLVSRRGVFPLSFTLDHIGPMTRTVEDNALMLAAIAGHDPLDPGSAAAGSGRYAAALDRGVVGLRIGFVRHFHEVDMPADPEVTAALENVMRTLQMLGADIRDIRLPSLNEFAAVNRVILQSEAWSIHAPWLRERPGDYGKLARQRLLAGAFLSAGDYVLASRRRTEMIASVNAALAEVDVLLCASSMDPACRIDRPADIERTYPRQARTPFNVTGHPALAMMSGLSSGGLPLSVQFVARYFDEAMLFRVARTWEQSSGVDKKHPAL
ncbi:aspartyl-tRNA(Asn)/glutamyl-tRNA(Gln) amidotransferase subunit A [Enhydrobacter aerosaccus]|uniref:Indoleacetamide hydrolase n=1 Tax=Enhydrobacter aerosaccus TaxID=225324 RepID=A0A1T4PG81_9HYPH|nr:Asp-tRNA(Asn)/Glu-tRNA(Gln) amidotransferase GatCAB subunit A [Enhydrobacter aerosaccus]SJZ90583.1 aspartyl-tRNA(Asn)/glutamyl-tRNA(Gln) amidotransferase subunit A [Enhydrobacter aerosaccus]